MLISIVIPTYNRIRLLRETIESIRTQTAKDFELIVVDDGSTDETREYLVAQGSTLRFVRQENRGPGAARNLGAQHAGGEYVAFVDSDDLWFDWTLQTFTKLIWKYGSPAILAARVLEFRNAEELSGLSGQELDADYFPDYLAASTTGYYVGSGMGVFRRSEFLSAGGFRTERMNAEDHDLALRLGTARGFVQVRSPVTLAWRRHSGGATTQLQSTVEGARY